MTASNGHPADNTRVLVIEDDKNLRDLLQLVLDTGEGIEVETLGDERDAVQVCQRYQPDVVILDLALPYMDSEEVAAQLRSERPDLRIISMSGFDPGDRPWADHQVVKTITLIDDLHRAIGHGERSANV